LNDIHDVSDVIFSNDTEILFSSSLITLERMPTDNFMFPEFCLYIF